MTGRTGRSKSSGQWLRRHVRDPYVHEARAQGRFAEKLEDIVGLYLNPPEHALVLCCDEKSQIQALDRTYPRAGVEEGAPADAHA